MNQNTSPGKLANAVASKHLAKAVSYGLPIAHLIGPVAEAVAQAHGRPTTSELRDRFVALMALLQTMDEARVLLDEFETCRTTELLSHEEAAYLVGLAIGAAVRGEP
jgi:hypothetical protein